MMESIRKNILKVITIIFRKMRQERHMIISVNSNQTFNITDDMI